MAVVINEFEMLPESRAPAPPASGEAPSGGAHAAEKVQPCAVAAALRSLDVQALRVMAH